MRQSYCDTSLTEHSFAFNDKHSTFILHTALFSLCSVCLVKYKRTWDEFAVCWGYLLPASPLSTFRNPPIFYHFSLYHSSFFNHSFFHISFPLFYPSSLLVSSSVDIPHFSLLLWSVNTFKYWLPASLLGADICLDSYPCFTPCGALFSFTSFSFSFHPETSRSWLLRGILSSSFTLAVRGCGRG